MSGPAGNALVCEKSLNCVVNLGSSKSVARVLTWPPPQAPPHLYIRKQCKVVFEQCTACMAADCAWQSKRSLWRRCATRHVQPHHASLSNSQQARMLGVDACARASVTQALQLILLPCLRALYLCCCPFSQRTGLSIACFIHCCELPRKRWCAQRLAARSLPATELFPGWYLSTEKRDLN